MLNKNVTKLNLNMPQTIHAYLHSVYWIEYTLEDNIGRRLMDILQKRVHLLMKDKEENTMDASMAQNWLLRDVASAQQVHKSGSLR